MSKKSNPMKHATNPGISAVQESEAIAPKSGLNVLCMKCPVIRLYANGQFGTNTNACLRTGLNKTLALFAGGPDLAFRVSSCIPGFDQAQFDTEIADGKRSGSSCFTCADARANGAACPAGGCVLPIGVPAKTPIDLLTWNNCDLKEAGHPTIAKSVASSEYSNSLLSAQGKLFAYANGYYSKLSDDQLSRKVVPHLGNEGKANLALSIAKMIKLQSEESINGITPSPDHICFLNGTLNVTTGKLEQHCPENRLRNRIQHTYEATATCPNFLTFLNEIWEGDADRSEKIQLIREWMGYLFVADTRMQKMLILHGNGSNGKSVLMSVIEGIIGSNNISNAMLARVNNSDVRANMEGALLNVSADLPKATISADGELKAMISGDSIEASAKYQTSSSFRPYARFMVGTNNMPNCTDKSEAYIRRLMILTFNRKFEGADRKAHLLETLTPEISGVIAWAIGGLCDLRQRGCFNEPPSSIEAVTAYHHEIDPVKWFAETCIEVSGNASSIKSKDLHAAFVAWCRDEGVRPESVQEFGRRLTALNFPKRKSDTTWWLVKPKSSAERHFANIQQSNATATPGVIDSVRASATDINDASASNESQLLQAA